VIKASAALVALAIGLLVAGVLASSLLMVYISIGVCAVAALILAAGVLSHWSEIFGRGGSRSASAQEAWSAPQVPVSTSVLASAEATATGGREHRRSPREEAGERTPAPPVEVVHPQPEFPAAGRSDDLWGRVEEELGSAGKRDTGALSWPGTELPVPPESPGPPEGAGPPPRAGPREAPSAGAKAWMWGSGGSWKPPETADPAWPPPAAAFAAPAAGETAEPVPEAAAAEPAPDADEASPDSPDDEATSGSPEDETAGLAPEDDLAGSASDDEVGRADARRDRPQWIISLPGRESPPAEPPSPVGETGTKTEDPVVDGTDAAAAESAAGESGRETGPSGGSRRETQGCGARSREIGAPGAPRRETRGRGPG
jgi:hypothetical protein